MVSRCSLDRKRRRRLLAARAHAHRLRFMLPCYKFASRLATGMPTAPAGSVVGPDRIATASHAVSNLQGRATREKEGEHVCVSFPGSSHQSGVPSLLCGQPRHGAERRWRLPIWAQTGKKSAHGAHASASASRRQLKALRGRRRGPEQRCRTGVHGAPCGRTSDTPRLGKSTGGPNVPVLVGARSRQTGQDKGGQPGQRPGPARELVAPPAGSRCPASPGSRIRPAAVGRHPGGLPTRPSSGASCPPAPQRPTRAHECETHRGFGAYLPPRRPCVGVTWSPGHAAPRLTESLQFTSTCRSSSVAAPARSPARQAALRLPPGPSRTALLDARAPIARGGSGPRHAISQRSRCALLVAVELKIHSRFKSPALPKVKQSRQPTAAGRPPLHRPTRAAQQPLRFCCAPPRRAVPVSSGAPAHPPDRAASARPKLVDMSGPLEDKFLRLRDENTDLKKTCNDQKEAIKR